MFQILACGLDGFCAREGTPARQAAGAIACSEQSPSPSIVVVVVIGGGVVVVVVGAGVCGAVQPLTAATQSFEFVTRVNKRPGE
jgi:CBS domain containing-hemolysin-like protein